MYQNFSGMRNTVLFLLVAIPLLLAIYNISSTKHSIKKTIRIGIDEYPGFEHLFIAKKQGFFKEAGLDVELVELSSLVAVRRAFERGKIDGMASTLIEVLEAYKYSNRIAQVVLAIDFSEGADVILASPSIKAMRNLKGKKIGVESGGLSFYMIYRALELNNMKPTDVTLIPMQQHKLLSSLKSKKVDAITSYPPDSITVQKHLQVNKLFDSSHIRGEILDVLSIDKKVLDDHPDLQRKLQHVWAKTMKYIDANPEEAYATLVERFPISMNEFKEAMKDIHLIKSSEQSNFLAPNGVVQQTLEKISSIVFMDNNEEQIKYSQFIYNLDLS